MKTEQRFPFPFQSVRVFPNSQIIVIILFLSFLLSCSTIQSITKSGKGDSGKKEVKSNLKQNKEKELAQSKKQRQSVKESKSSIKTVETKNRGATNSLMKLGGQGNRMVGGIMEKMGKDREGTAAGSLLTKGGQIHTAVGSAAENSADKNKGVGEALKTATTAGKGALNDNNNVSNQRIKKSQELLISKGYAQGKADGIMGGKTVNAIKKYQKDNGLPITGKLDTDTCKCMGI